MDTEEGIHYKYKLINCYKASVAEFERTLENHRKMTGLNMEIEEWMKSTDQELCQELFSKSPPASPETITQTYQKAIQRGRETIKRLEDSLGLDKE